MADATNAPPAVDATKADDETTRPVDAPTEPVAGEAKPEEGGDVAPEAESAEESKEVAQADAPTEKPTSDANDDDTKVENDTAEEVASTPNTKKTPNGNRRKSTSKASGGNKKTPAKKKATVTPRLDVEPGDVFFVAMKGFQPWPVIVCDEEMLPEALLSKRPVSAKRIDGTYREDFLEGGKNAKDRRYPVMFMGSNEFAWQVNTDLQDLDLDAIKKDVEAGNSQKKTKGLWEAYQIAAEGHDLAWFKDVLEGHEQAMQHDADEKEAAAAAKKEKDAKKGKRKSLAAEDVEEDVAEGTASAKKAKPSKKRKKDSESDGEPEKATKTPKTTKLKLNAPKDASAAKPKKETKAKKTKAKNGSEEAEAAKPQEPQETEAERYEKQQKSVLYLRHKLQKGFISREDPPSADEMPQMSTYIKQLENTDEIAASIIKKTKVHKVLKGIIKLDSIPREDEFEFKRRSTELLTRWAKVLSADTEAAEPASVTPAAPTTNGVNHKPGGADEASNKPEEAEKEAEAPSKADGDGDVAMVDAKDEAPAVEATEEPATEPAAKATEEVETS